MAIIKCRMCGGDLEPTADQSVVECAFCGSKQTVPSADNEKKLSLFARAERLRKNCEFDKAAGIYESIVAEFPDEAESYWGLVLCKYGIEYVDDPATGRKIPTCHRSSFSSILDDTDLEQAIENADISARRVYREQARQLEEIRKGIVQVSAGEAPYDIFICYKETDEHGDRTLDSVLAQDIYDALVREGYRVFFARISLEDKLGLEYEPYIFAALNSARIMLAVGTDHEYFDAVWVKNEWSRFLKLMSADHSKHLIPCYKGLDAYDMPKEFAKLQAQDLGKLGAIQDLIRGIGKLMPGKQQAAPVQETATVPVLTDSALQAKRGMLALEDKDWEAAERFFEQALDKDPENAEAYLGKALVQERCAGPQALAAQRLSRYTDPRPAVIRLPAPREHVEASVRENTIPGVLDAVKIRGLYRYSLEYTSTVDARKAQLEQEQLFWKEHKLLGKAFRFAQGDTAQNLERIRGHVLSTMEQKLRQAEEEEREARQATEEQLREQLELGDKQAASLRSSGLRAMEARYDAMVITAKTSSEIARLGEARYYFESMKDHRDSRAMAKHCAARIEEEREKALLEKESAERRLADEAARQHNEQLRRNELAGKTALKAGGIIVLILQVLIIIVNVKAFSDAFRYLRFITTPHYSVSHSDLVNLLYFVLKPICIVLSVIAALRPNSPSFSRTGLIASAVSLFDTVLCIFIPLYFFRYHLYIQIPLLLVCAVIFLVRTVRCAGMGAKERPLFGVIVPGVLLLLYAVRLVILVI